MSTLERVKPISKIFAIRNKASGEFVSLSNWPTWSSIGRAKGAWSIATTVGDARKGAFDKQTEYEIVNLLELLPQKAST